MNFRKSGFVIVLAGFLNLSIFSVITSAEEVGPLDVEAQKDANCEHAQSSQTQSASEREVNAASVCANVEGVEASEVPVKRPEGSGGGTQSVQ